MMVRVGVDEEIGGELLARFSAAATIVRIPRHPVEPLDVDFWIIPFFRRDAADVFRMLRGVKVMQSLMAGVDWILPWLPEGVVLCDGRGIHDTSTSEWVLAAILASLKRFPEYRDLQLKGEWRRRALTEAAPASGTGGYPLLGDELGGKTVLIVGYGSIGKAIEARLLPFGVSLLRVARTAKADPVVHSTNDLHHLIPKADVVVIVVPMVPNTRGLFGAAEIGRMREGALLVNAARGPVVDTAALIAALNSGRIMAALDVTDPEPLPAGHALWHARNCLITPHTAGSTPQFIHRAFHFAASQVGRFAKGEHLENIVDESGY